jgi:hypothetical protein
MRILSRLVISFIATAGLTGGTTSAIYAVEIPKPVINIPKPNIPRPTINVPRPSVTVNVPKPVINVPKPTVTVNVPKPTINVPKPAVTVNVPKPVVNVPKPTVTVNVPKPAVVVPKVDIPKPAVVVTVPKVDVPRPAVPQPVVSVSKPTVPTVQVTAPTVPLPAMTSPVVQPNVQVALPPKTVGPVNPPSAVVGTPESVVEINPPKTVGPVLPPANPMIGNPKALGTMPDGPKVVSPLVPPTTVIATPTNGTGTSPPKVGGPVTAPVAELPKQTGPATTPGSTSPNGIANGPSTAPVGGPNADPPKISNGGPKAVGEATVESPPVRRVGGPNADPPKISNGGSKAVGEAIVESPPGKRVGGPNADPPKISNGGNRAVGEATSETAKPASNQVNLPNGTFGRARQNPDGTVTVSNNFGTVTLTPQQMSNVAKGDMSALKPLMGSAQSNGSASQSFSSKVSLSNGSFGNATMNPDGTVTVSNNFGSVTLTKQQMSQVAAGNMSALGPLMGSAQSSGPGANANGAPQSISNQVNLPNGAFGKATLNPDGTVTVSNNLGTVTLSKQQMTQIAAGNMSALAPLMGSGSAQNKPSGNTPSQATFQSSSNQSGIPPNQPVGAGTLPGGGPYTINGKSYPTRTCNDGGCEYFGATGSGQWVPATGSTPAPSTLGAINTSGAQAGNRSWPYSICASPGNCQYWDNGGNSVLTMNGQVVACAGNACTGSGSGGSIGRPATFVGPPINSAGAGPTVNPWDAEHFGVPIDLRSPGNYPTPAQANNSQPADSPSPLPQATQTNNPPPVDAPPPQAQANNSQPPDDPPKQDQAQANNSQPPDDPPPSQAQANNTQPPDDPPKQDQEQANNSQPPDDPPKQDQANNAASPADENKNADASSDAPSKSLGQMANDLKNDAKQLITPENEKALAEAYPEAQKVREDTGGWAKDKLSDAGSTAGKQYVTDKATEQLMGKRPDGGDQTDQSWYDFGKGLVGKEVDSAKNLFTTGLQSLSSRVDQVKSIFNFNTNNTNEAKKGMDKVSAP